MASLFSRAHPARRRVLLTAVVLAETAAILVLAEAGLRVCGYGHSEEPFIKKEYGGSPWYLLNDRYYDQFFNPDSWHRDYDVPNSTIIRGIKPPNTYRVFLFGSSAAYGWFFPEYGMGPALETMLRNKFPETQFEVVTVAYHAMNSFTMRRLADACAQLQPDLFLVYMGNNEMIGPYGLQTVLGSTCRSAAVMQAMVRINLWFSNLRLFQLCGIPAQRLSSKAVAHLRWGGRAGLTEAGDPRLERVYQTFRQNLESICEAARRAGAQTTLCTVGYNLGDWPPTEFGHRKALSQAELERWNGSFLLGRSREEAQAHDEAIRAYEQAAAIDDTHAELMYNLGRCFRAAGNYPRARECFLQAVDNRLNFISANTRINAIISEVASSRRDDGVRLADTEQALASRSPGGITGNEFFYDHVHLTFDGNCTIAGRMFQEMADLVQNKGRHDQDDSPTPPSTELCSSLMGYSPAVQLRDTKAELSRLLESEPGDPLVPRLRSIQNRLEEQVGPGTDIAVAIAEGERQGLALDGGNIRLRGRYVESLGGLLRFDEALNDARLLVESAPCCWKYRSNLAMAAMARHPEEALLQCRELLAIYPEYAGTQKLAGDVALRTGDADRAVGYYKEALTLSPGNVRWCSDMGKAFAIRGEFNKAAVFMKKAIALDAAQADEAVDFLRPAVAGYQGSGDWKRVVEGLEAMLQMKPDLDEARPQLVAALCELKDFDAAWEQAAECRKRSVAVPKELVERLRRDSGRDR